MASKCASVGFGQAISKSMVDEAIQAAADLRNSTTPPAEPPEPTLAQPPAISAPSTGRLSFKSLLVRRGLEKRTAVATAALPSDPIAPDVSTGSTGPTGPTGSPVSDAPAAAAAPAAPDAAQRKRNAFAKERSAACKSTFSAPDPSPIKRPRTAIGLNKVSPATMSEERRQRTANAAQILANLHFPGEDLDIPGADGDLKNIGKGVQSTVEWAKLNFTNCRVDGALDEMHKQRMKAMMKKDLVSRR